MHLNLYFAWAAWITLNLILISRPLSDLFKLNIFGKIVVKRKILGWICGILAISHIFIFAANFNLPLTFFFDLKYWNFSTSFGWGLLAFTCLIPLLITSNKKSIILFKKNWKRIQRLTYLFFIAGGIHIYLVGGKWYFTLLPMGIWFLLFVLAKIRKTQSLNI